MSTAIHHFVGPALLTLLAFSAWTDLTQRRIANGAVLCVLALALLHSATLSFSAALGHLAVGVGTFAVLYVLWRFGVVGGGDLKLIVAVALLAGPERIAVFLVWTAIAGGFLAVFVWISNRWGFDPLTPALQSADAWIHEVGHAAAARFGFLSMAQAAAAKPTGSADAVDLSKEVPYAVAIAFGGCAMWFAS